MLHQPTGCFDGESICLIPLYDREGSVRANVRVDPDDWFALARYRWHLMNNGYAAGYMTTRTYRREGWRGQRVGGRSRQVLMHRFIAGMESGDRRKVDHVNRDRLDNRRANLRVVTDPEHSQNQTPQRGRSSQYRGVSWFPQTQRWRAYAGVNGRFIHLGYFIDEEEAAMAAAEFRAAHMPCSAEGTAA